MTIYAPRPERVGFTGTRQGMTGFQREVVRKVLLTAMEAHHGDCQGADAEFHELATAGGIETVIHPPEDDKLRAWCRGDMVLLAKPYLERNKDIVDLVDVLVACPKEAKEPRIKRGSGTWQCIGYARRVGRRTLIVWPDGTSFLEDSRE